MQTSKIKIGSAYAMKRSDELVAFQVTEIVNRKTSNASAAVNEIHGFIVEDRVVAVKAGTEVKIFKIEPDRLIGPYEEQVELVERRRVEREEAEAAVKASRAKAMADRLSLYRFVGVEAPAKADDYRQLFRLHGYSASYVDITNEGAVAIIAKVNEVNAMLGEAERTNVVLPFQFKG